MRIHPIVGNPIVSRISSYDVQAWWDALAALPRRRGNGTYANKTIVATLDTFRQILKHARRIDPACKGHDPIGVAERRRGLAAEAREAMSHKLIDFAGARRLVSYATTLPQQGQLWLAIHGFRRGEVSGIQLRDVGVDDDGGVVVEMNRSIIYLKSGGWQIRASGKSLREREVPVTDHAGAVLRDLVEARRAQGAGVTDWLFRGRHDPADPLAGDTLDQVVKRVVARHNKAQDPLLALPANLHPHALRHSFVTNLLDQGTPLTVVPALVTPRRRSRSGSTGTPSATRRQRAAVTTLSTAT